MRIEEARAIARWIRELDLPRGSVCLNLGSSTGKFRREAQPHIHTELFAPLEEAGLVVVHCDAKDAEGVDEVGDLLDSAFRAKLRSHNAKLILCCNLLEHLEAPDAFARACGDLVRSGGHGIFSVPYSYPYHPDPLDNMLRPSPSELSGMLPGWVSLREEVIRGGNHWTDLRATGRPMVNLMRHVARVAMPFYRRSHWRHIAHRLLWLYRPFKSSVVLVRRFD